MTSNPCSNMESEKVASAHSDLSARRIALGAVGGVLPFHSSDRTHGPSPTRSGELEVVGRMYQQRSSIVVETGRVRPLENKPGKSTMANL